MDDPRITAMLVIVKKIQGEKYLILKPEFDAMGPFQILKQLQVYFQI
jgi:hypothetical protein